LNKIEEYYGGSSRDPCIAVDEDFGPLSPLHAPDEFEPTSDLGRVQPKALLVIELKGEVLFDGGRALVLVELESRKEGENMGHPDLPHDPRLIRNVL
jgi:hypothetical protein